MIIAFVGPMGSGKTLSMTYFVHKYFMDGSKIYANYGLKFAHEPIDYEKVKKLSSDFQNAVVAIDEIHVFIDSRSSMKSVNKAVSYFITQSRKRNLVLMYSTQNIDQVDKRLRMNTDYFFSCKSYKTPDGKVFIKQKMTTISGMTKSMILPGHEVYHLYDTHEIVNPFVDDEDS